MHQKKWKNPGIRTIDIAKKATNSRHKYNKSSKRSKQTLGTSTANNH